MMENDDANVRHVFYENKFYEDIRGCLT